MGFKREEDSHFLYSICKECGERLVFSAAGARPEEIEKAEAQHVCDGPLKADNMVELRICE